jgi:tetratricopeptide (TPR) repeat protein
VRNYNKLNQIKMGLFDRKKEEKLTGEPALFLMAASLLQNGEHQKSLEVFNKLISEYVSNRVNFNDTEIAEQDAMIYYNRSLAKYYLNDMQGAIDDLKISVSISELNQAYYQLFVIYHNQDKPQEGIDYLVKSYKLGNKEAENILRQNTNYFNQ